MCGIVGALAFGDLPEDKEAVRQEIMRIITTELMLATESRGKDATGAVILFNDGNYYGIKRGTRVSTFLSKFGTSKETYGSLLKVWRNTESPVRAFIGHCRATTRGTTYNNVDNHPIKVGNLVGVHNGTLKNDDIIVENLGCKRDGKVDSEAIFRLAAHYTNNGSEPFTMDTIKEIVHRLDGSFSVVMFNADNPYQIPVFRDARPMEFVFINDLGLLIILSDKDFWDVVHCSYERMVHYYDQELPSLLPMKIEKGTLENDGAAIFDLTTEVDADTTLKQLAEWGKLPGTGRIWKTAATTYVGAYNRNYNKAVDTTTTASTTSTAKATAVGDVNSNKTNSTTNNSTTTKNNGDNVKRHIFDTVTRKYTVKIGDTVPGNDESVNIPVKNTALTDIDEDDKQNTGAKIVDFTVYNKKKVELDTDDEVVVGGTVTEVDMSQDPPELVEAAARNYDLLPAAKRGFTETDQLLDAIEIKDEAIAKSLGHLLLANRVFKYAWNTGFIRGCSYTTDMLDEDIEKIDAEKTKIKNREKHIVVLKSLVVLLAQFFNETAKDTNDVNAKLRLSSIAMKQNLTLAELTSVEDAFHKWQKDRISGVKEVVQQAAAINSSMAPEDTKDEDETTSSSV